MKRLIHFLWHDEQLPAKRFVEEAQAMNPEALVRVWTFAEAEGVLLQVFPAMMELYRSMPFLLQRANLLRMAILARHGGIYLDLDMECLRPFDEGNFFASELVLGNVKPAPHYTVCNAILGAAEPGHPLWEQIMRTIRLLPPGIRRDTEAIKTTGALLLSGEVRLRGYERWVQPKAVFFPVKHSAPGAFTFHHAGFPAWVGKQFVDGKLITSRSDLHESYQ